MKLYLFVCSGNICRSPMAEAIARDRLAAAGVPARVMSAGTLGLVGCPADPHSVTAVAELGLDLTAHASRGVTHELLEQAERIVVMAPEHASVIEQRAPHLAARIDRMWLFSGDELRHIADPVGGTYDGFVACRDQLVRCIDAWVAAQA